MKKCFVLLAVLICFSGCFDGYIYLIPLKDNSYILSQRVSFGIEMLKAFNGLRTMDSTGKNTQKDILSPKAMMDSFLVEAKKQNDFQALPGYLGISYRDSLFDTTAFFITDIHIRSVTDLPVFLKSAQSDKKSPPELLIDLTTSHSNGATKFEFTAIKSKSGDKSPGEIIDLERLDTGGLHVGVLSEKLVPSNATSPRISIPGGEEWYIPFKSLTDWQKVKPKKVEFQVKD